LNFALRIKEVVSENYDILNLTNYPLWNASNCSFPLIDMMTLLDNSNITSTNTSTAMNNDLTNYANDIWLMIVTMTTGRIVLKIIKISKFLVGYGDYVPKTISGRVITFIACMIGLIAVSLMTIILQNILTLNTAEARVFFYKFLKFLPVTVKFYSSLCLFLRNWCSIKKGRDIQHLF